MSTDYRSYTHVERLSSEECDGLLDNDVVNVTAKIDGTNAVMWYDPDRGEVRAGSRKREVNWSKDNAGFYKWSQSDAKEAARLRKYLIEHPTRMVYGEWMGEGDKFVGSIKDYDAFAHGKLFIFDVFDREIEDYLPDIDWRLELAGYGLEGYFAELLAVLDHPTYEDIASVAERNKFLLNGSERRGEGVVCKAPGWKNRWGRTCYGKLVLDEYVQHQGKQKPKTKRPRSGVEVDIVNEYVTDSEIDKTMAKVVLECDADSFDKKSPKMMGMLIGFTWRDLLDECQNWVKRHKKPVVDFRELNGAMCERLREYVFK